MSGPATIAIFADNAVQRAYLAWIVTMAGCQPAGEDVAAAVLSLTLNQGTPQKNAICFDKPLKAADMIQRLRSAVTTHTAPPERVEMGGAVLDTVENLWLPAEQPPVRLTDRETDILLSLYMEKGEVVGRDQLLRKVWSYAPEVETHTLETHIYRLRQKIEKDSSNPAILLTEGDGYRLAF